jgi:molecular chaperone DnaK
VTSVVFGIDFGTTNSIATAIVGDRSLPLVDLASHRPHPSVVWYRGVDTVVGRVARESMDLTETGAPPGFVRSPKMSLRREGPIFVDGRPIDPKDAVADVLRHIKTHATEAREGASGYDLNCAVMTIPVDFGGNERRALRTAASKAGIAVAKFVHEPVAALYAYLRSSENMTRELAALDGRSVLVFDWGGGTLDLTLCRIQGGSIMQVSSLGDNEIGGDKFDENLRNLLREKHAKTHEIEDIRALEQPGMAAKLLHQCEIVKILLSNREEDEADVIIRNYLNIEGSGQNLVATITREELERQSTKIVARGLAKIDEILETSSLTYQDIDLCLATGGMVNMPAIRDGLTERFLGRVPNLENGDTIISEGAAWIAKDGLPITLSKPIEILIADTSGFGTYYPLVEAGCPLPIENEIQEFSNTRLFCTDPREGVAVVEIAKPMKLGRVAPSDARVALCVTHVKMDKNAKPLLERINCHLQIDHDYIVKVVLKSTGQQDETVQEFHDLDFGLSLIKKSVDGDGNKDKKGKLGDPARPIAVENSNLAQRPNVILSANGDPWRIIPGDLVYAYKPNYFDVRNGNATSRQKDEYEFYVPCNRCKRTITQINQEGFGAQCTTRCGL